MCFQIIPLCPACEEPSGLGEEIIYAEDVCAGHCTSDTVCGTTTRLMTQREVDNPDFECLTPGCVNVRSGMSLAEEEAEVQAARDHARQFLRDRYQNCLSLCILPFYDPPESPFQTHYDSDPVEIYVAPMAKPNAVRRRQDRPWSKKRGKPWGPEEEAILWKLRRKGMEFDDIAKQIDRTERGCYDRFNKLRNEGYGRR
ncbi:hypothetical protein M406DRAFT_330510 [Cryphonectria parasitica EP155]|uniref:Myb-like domain-containing protein n=1 Tax=Cryphonectria parasitica (strain ATCC 38755 / EP155) TaxID=660469 RepID=A0A9P4Y006_CRYP1|nr:uncharacterized protein M406DRAFT_330510 [Cryphonectria parasitica EP155]KAF3764158.1 hypothetical protein M406DRAFT_330510 [Cryphonectria parasitica EP155]